MDAVTNGQEALIIPLPMPSSTDTERVLLDHRARFLSFLERRVGNRATAEELLQEAFVRTLESRAVPEEEEGAVTWFYRLLRNALVDHHRRQAVRTRAGEALAREATEAADDPELHQAVCACLHGLLPTLKPEYADMVRRVDLEESAVAEVAQTLGVSANNASVRLHRARQALKRQLQRACGACATHGCLDCSCGHGGPGGRKVSPL
jgi:RNA polymerase sigma-70 factor (ECF subfamily)